MSISKWIMVTCDDDYAVVLSKCCSIDPDHFQAIDGTSDEGHGYHFEWSYVPMSGEPHDSDVVLNLHVTHVRDTYIASFHPYEDKGGKRVLASAQLKAILHGFAYGLVPANADSRFLRLLALGGFVKDRSSYVSW